MCSSCYTGSFLVETAATLRMSTVEFFGRDYGRISTVTDALPHSHLISGWGLGSNKQPRELASNEGFVHV